MMIPAQIPCKETGAQSICTLRQSREMYDAYRKQIEACDKNSYSTWEN